jgi:hypothetical protein
LLPNVHDQHFASGQGEQGAFALEILVLSAFAAIGAFHIHDKNVLRHSEGAIRVFHAGVVPVLCEPDALCGLAAFVVGHDTELRTEKEIEQSRFASRLGPEDGDEVVIEAGVGDMFEGQISR